jgi:hypothetical protein
MLQRYGSAPQDEIMERLKRGRLEGSRIWVIKELKTGNSVRAGFNYSVKIRSHLNCANFSSTIFLIAGFQLQLAFGTKRLENYLCRRNWSRSSVG